MSTSLPTSNTVIGSHDHFHLSTNERRIRNRSLCSLLLTPPLYPGYSAKLDKSLKSNFYRSSWKSTVSEIATPSNPISSNSISVDCYPSSTQSVTGTTNTFQREISFQLQSTENSPKKYTNSKESSGYSSGTSESDLENEQHSKKTLATTNTDSSNNTTMNDNYNNNISGEQEVGKVERATKRPPTRQQRNRQHTLEKNRRRSVPASLRDAFTDEIVRVLEINGVFQYETDAVSFHFDYYYHHHQISLLIIEDVN
ncbi:unnamed protein product [Onchocerca flexuosa]|uniref:BHLH domain-containing protein n=1 Tax=Onchocerca flexuosa TaxID=387005 RepID=A0A183I4E5_9BILA|nr:unnamed protein product [Onchocerca flexuosa]